MTVQELPIADASFAIGPSYPQLLSALSGWFRGRGVPNEEAKDLGQETVVRTLVHLKRHGERGDDLKALAFTIARNLLADRARRHAGTFVTLTEEIDVADPSPSPLERLVQNEERTAVADALASLGSRHRKVIELWMRGETPVDIARTLGIKRNAADALLHRARRRLASVLRETGGAFGSFIGLIGFRLRRAAFSLARNNPAAVLAQAASMAAVVGISGALITAGVTGVGHATGPSQMAKASVVQHAATIAGAPSLTKAAQTRSSGPNSPDVYASVADHRARATTDVVNPTTGKQGLVGIELTHERNGRTGHSEAILDAGTRALCGSGCPTIGGSR